MCGQSHLILFDFIYLHFSNMYMRHSNRMPVQYYNNSTTFVVLSKTESLYTAIDTI